MDDAVEFWSADPSTQLVQTNPDIVFGSSPDIRVKQNVAYIVCGVILRGSKDAPEVLMIQEVESDWYLPAGRMEPGETIEDGMKREVLEEAGVECASLGLICVETTARSPWYRFTYLAQHTGGTLKTLAQRDQESRQAAWFRADHVIAGNLPDNVNLRGRDIVRLIQLACDRMSDDDDEDHTPVCSARVIARPLVGLHIRCVLVSQDMVLLRNHALPLVEYSLAQHLNVIIKQFLQTVCGSSEGMDTAKVVCIESYPIPAHQHDGFRLSILVEMPSALITAEAGKNGYEWVDAKNSRKLSDCLRHWRQNYAVLKL